MKKILLLIIGFLLAGCTNEYTIEIKDGKIKENITISNEIVTNDFCEDNPSNECDNDSFEYLTYNYFPLSNSDEEYDIEVINKDNMVHNVRKYNFTYDNYKHSYVLNNCFESFDYSYENFIININVKNISKCYQNEDILIKVKVNNRVLENNADEIKNDTYIWHVNENNYETFDLNIKVLSLPITKIIIYSSIIIVFIIIVLFLRTKFKKINEIK